MRKLTTNDITHSFKANEHIIELFKNVDTFKKFKYRIEALGNKMDVILRDDFKGDAFEFFVEILLKSDHMGTITSINGNKYEVIHRDSDLGCDGYAENLNGETCAIQIKFRSNSSETLHNEKDKLSSMIVEGLKRGITYGFDKKYRRHFIITTAKDIYNKTKELKFGGLVKCINYTTLCNHLDKNPIFWDNCRILVQELVDEKIKSFDAK